MTGIASFAILFVLALAGVASPSLASSPEEERLLGCGCEQARFESYLPFTRAIGISGVVKGGLASSATTAGVPPAVMLEVTEALATAIDLDRDVRDGDRFYVRYEQMFTIDDVPIETGHVKWAEVRTAAKGLFALHLFRPADASHATLWLASGQGTAASELEMPLKSIAVTSGFGVRADPLDQPWASKVAMGPIGPGPGGAGFGWNNWRPSVIPKPSPLLTGVRPASPLTQAPSSGAAASGLASPGAARFSGFRGGGVMAMHEGVDLVAAIGTPVYAAGDGVVLGAEPKGRYGNWIEIDHAGKLATVYGHLSAFAPGIVAGAKVGQGDLIGFTGNTGRVTGPHLHFEIRVNGRPTNPIGNPALKHAQLRGLDLQQFHKVVAADVAEREREARAM